MSAPLFSVILPTFGRPAFLAEAVDSVLDQTVQDLECLVVDDGGATGERPEWRDSRVRVIRRATNGGPAAARNSGLREASGTYVCFLDDDDIFTPDRLAIALEGLRRAPMTLCWRRSSDGRPVSNRLLEGRVADVILREGGPGLHQVCIERARVPLFDEAFDAVEDMDWLLRAAQDHPVTTVPKIGYIIRSHGQTRLRHGTRARIDGTRRLLEKHATYFAADSRAAAFRWKRTGLMMMAVGEHRSARRALMTSLRRSPSVRTAYHLIRAAGSGGREPRMAGRAEAQR